MKNLVYMVLFMLLGLATFAQAPQMFNYQAVLRDAGGNILANQDLDIEVKILKSGIEGTVVFSELHQTFSNEFGIINLQIGSESSLNGINWSDDNYFVQISVDGALMGTSQLMSVPFALHAKTAENVFSGDYNDLSNTPDLSIYLTEIGNQNLANLGDVNLDNLSDNQILKYDAASGKWIAVDVSAASEVDPIFTISEAYNITNAGSGQVITDAERAKLNNIENGAQANVKSDWNAIEGDAQILNKPEFADVATSGNYNDLNNKPDFSEFLTDISSQSIGNLSDVDLSNVSDNKILKFNASSGKWEAVDVAAASESDPLYSVSAAAGISNAGSGMVITNDERTKLAGIQDGAELNVNADWNAVEGDAMILNKPNLANVATSGNYDDLSNKPILFDGTYNALSGKPVLSNVATTGSYNDLSNTPALHSVATSGNYNELVNKPILFDGTYNALSGKPVLSDVATTGSYNDLSDKPSLFDGTWASLTGKPSLAAVASTGSYNDLSNKPTTISAVQANAIDANTAKRSYPLADETKLAGIQAGAQVNVKADWNAISGDAHILNKPAFATVAMSGDFEDLTNIPSFSPVAFSGDYDDLLNKPAGFDGAWESISGKPAFANVATTGDFEDLLNIPTFSSMAFSNNYDDLENKPTLFNGTWASLSGKPALSTVATSGSYNDLSNTPALHSVASSGNYNELVNKPALFDGTWASLSGKPALSTVATSGSYNDLSNTPSLHSVATSGNYNELVNRPTLATVASTGSYNDLSNKPAVFSGSFNDLSNKPTTLAGYGITNAMTTSHTANSITSTQVSNWNTAYTWGNHAGLYRSSTWVPTWTQVTGKPVFATVATSGNYNDLSNKPNLSTYATKNMASQNITNLANPVNAQDAATKAYVDLLESRIAQMEEVLLGAGMLTIKDGDGNEYGVVEIGGQYWLDQNLKTTKLNDGTPIANVPNVNTFIWTMTPAFAWYNNNIANKETYGALYNYYVVETGKVCPAGWHVPTMADWDALVAYLGGVHVTGGKLKEIGTSTWLAPNTGATNSSGFTARPGGMRFSGSGSDLDLGYSAFLWSTETNPVYPSEVYTRELGYFKSRMDKFSVNKNTGASIRCVKD